MKRTRDGPPAPPPPGSRSLSICHCRIPYIAARRVLAFNGRTRAPAGAIGSHTDRQQNAHGVSNLYRDDHINPGPNRYTHAHQPAHTDRHAHPYQNAHGVTNLYRDGHANSGGDSYVHADELANSLRNADKHQDTNCISDALSNTCHNADQHKYPDSIAHADPTFGNVDAVAHPYSDRDQHLDSNANPYCNDVRYAVRDSNERHHLDLDSDADSNSHCHADNLALPDRDEYTHPNIYTAADPLANTYRFANARFRGDRNASAAPDSRKRTIGHV